MDRRAGFGDAGLAQGLDVALPGVGHWVVPITVILLLGLVGLIDPGFLPRNGGVP